MLPIDRLIYSPTSGGSGGISLRFGDPRPNPATSSSENFLCCDFVEIVVFVQLRFYPFCTFFFFCRPQWIRFLSGHSRKENV